MLVDFLVISPPEGQGDHLSDEIVLSLLALPELLTFIVGVYCLYVSTLFYEEMKHRGLETGLEELPLGEKSNIQMVFHRDSVDINQMNKQNFVDEHQNGDYVRTSSIAGILFRRQPDEVDVLEVPENAMEQNLCIICMDKQKNSVFVPCGHECVCHPCGDKFMRQAASKLCPLCRDRVT